MSLEILYGVALILVAASMLWIAKPAQGQDSAPWLRVFIVGQIYIMAAMVCVVTGTSLIIAYWP